MTLTLLIVIGAVVGWLLPRLMGNEAYGIAVDLGVAVGGAVLGGLIFNVAVGGWFAGALAGTLFASAGVVVIRQVRKNRDKQQATLAAARASSRRRAAGARY